MVDVVLGVSECLYFVSEIFTSWTPQNKEVPGGRVIEDVLLI